MQDLQSTEIEALSAIYGDSFRVSSETETQRTLTVELITPFPGFQNEVRILLDITYDTTSGYPERPPSAVVVRSSSTKLLKSSQWQSYFQSIGQQLLQQSEELCFEGANGVVFALVQQLIDSLADLYAQDTTTTTTNNNTASTVDNDTTTTSVSSPASQPQSYERLHILQTLKRAIHYNDDNSDWKLKMRLNDFYQMTAMPFNWLSLQNESQQSNSSKQQSSKKKPASTSVTDSIGHPWERIGAASCVSGHGRLVLVGGRTRKHCSGSAYFIDVIDSTTRTGSYAQTRGSKSPATKSSGGNTHQSTTMRVVAHSPHISNRWLAAACWSHSMDGAYILGGQSESGDLLADFYLCYNLKPNHAHSGRGPAHIFTTRLPAINSILDDAAESSPSNRDAADSRKSDTKVSGYQGSCASIVGICGHAMCCVGSEHVVVFGGYMQLDSRRAPVTLSNELLIYAWRSNWRRAIEPERLQRSSAEVPAPRAGHAIVAVQNAVYIYGGITTANQILGDLWVYDMTSGVFTAIEVKSVFRPRAAFFGGSLTHTLDSLFFAGGITATDHTAEDAIDRIDAITDLSDAEAVLARQRRQRVQSGIFQFDLATRHWSVLVNPAANQNDDGSTDDATGRAFHCFALIHNASMVIGGVSGIYSQQPTELQKSGDSLLGRQLTVAEAQPLRILESLLANSSRSAATVAAQSKLSIPENSSVIVNHFAKWFDMQDEATSDVEFYFAREDRSVFAHRFVIGVVCKSLYKRLIEPNESLTANRMKTTAVKSPPPTKLPSEPVLQIRIDADDSLASAEKPTLQFDVFFQFIRFLYCGRIELQSSDVGGCGDWRTDEHSLVDWLLSLYRLADFFKHKPLIELLTGTLTAPTIQKSCLPLRMKSMAPHFISFQSDALSPQSVHQFGSHLSPITSSGQLLRGVVILKPSNVDEDDPETPPPPPVYIHRSLLACASTIFNRMLEGGFVEGQSSVVEIENLSGPALTVLARYFYSGLQPHNKNRSDHSAATATTANGEPIETDLLSVAVELYHAADYLCLADMKSSMRTMIRESLDTSIVCQVLHISVHVNDELLRRACVFFIARNFSELEHDPEFQELDIALKTEISIARTQLRL